MDKLGIQPIQLLAQIFNFLILVILLQKFLYKPILKALDERKKKIEEGFVFSQKTKEELEEAEKKKEEMIKKARNEAKQIIEEAKKSGKKLEKEIVEAGEKEALEISEKAKKTLEKERLEMAKQMERETVEVALAMVEKILRDILTEKDHQVIIEKKLKDAAKFVK